MRQDYYHRGCIRTITALGSRMRPPLACTLSSRPPPPPHTHRVGAPSSKGPSKVNASVLAAFPSYPTLDTLKTPQLIRPPQV